MNSASSSRQDPGSASGGGVATYSTVQTSTGPTNIGYQPTYDTNDLAASTATLNISDYGNSNNFQLSRSPTQQWPAAPSSRGRPSQWQARGRAPAPRARSGPRLIAPTPGQTEKLDHNYRMRNKDYKKFFTCGRVFKTLWTDPAGPENDSENSQFMSTARYKVAHGEYVYSKIRRFIVVARHDRSCQCLPVTTYDGKGYKKRNIKLEEHGLIYVGNPPPLVPGIFMEPLLIKDAVEDLDLSYINYGRSYCVDTNVKVKNVGVLDEPSRKLLRKYYASIHTLSEDEESPGPPPSESRQTRETEFLGMGGGLPLPPLSSAPGYTVAQTQYAEPSTQYAEPQTQYSHDTPVVSSRPYSRPTESQYQNVEYGLGQPSSGRVAQSRTYSASSSSRPPVTQYRREAEINLDENAPPVRRSRRESNAGSERRKHRS